MRYQLVVEVSVLSRPGESLEAWDFRASYLDEVFGAAAPVRDKP